MDLHVSLDPLLLLEPLYTNGTAPIALWCFLHRRHQAVHMVAAVAIIAEEEFVVVFEVPQRVHVLHSMHCQGYSFTLIFMLSVNCRHVGWPALPQMEQPMSSS